MDSMGSAGKAADDSAHTVRRPRALVHAALPTTGAAQFATAFFPPNARAAAAMATAAAFTAAAGMPLRHPGTPSTGDIFLPGAYPIPLEPATVYHTLHYPYTMAIAKGSSFEGGEGAAASSKKPRTVFTPKQLLYLEEEFVKNQFPNMEQRKKMAKTLDLTQQHIQIWFQNRRAKKRRKKKRYSEEERMRKDPEPPPFWPSNLPFSSNLGDISMKSKKNTGKPERPSAARELETNGRGPPSVTPPQASERSPQDSHLAKDYTPPPTLFPSSLPPLNNRPTNNLTHDAGRPSHLPCSASTQDPPLKSPSQAGTPGNGHSQLPTPPPYTPPITTSHHSVSSALMMTSHPTTREVVLTPPGDLTMHHFPPLPPPESILSGNYEDPTGFLTCSLAPPVYDPVISLYTTARSGGSVMLPPPPYSFSSSSLSSTSIPQSSYTPDHHSTNSNNLFIHPQSLSNSSSNSNLSNPHLKPLPLTTEMTTSGPSSLSPSTLSPLTNSDCSPSPITQDLPLPPPSERNFSLALSTRGSVGGRGPTGISSPIHATDPVVLHDIQGDWDFLSRSAFPVVQTDHEMWAAPGHANTRPGFPPRRKSGPGTSPPGSLVSAGTLSSSQLYSGVYGAEYLPPFTSDPVTGLAGFAAVTSISNGAN